MGLINKKTLEYISINTVNSDHVNLRHMETKAARDKQKKGSHWPKEYGVGMYVPGLNEAVEAAVAADLGTLNVGDFEKKKAYELLKAAPKATISFRLQPDQTIAFDKLDWTDDI